MYTHLPSQISSTRNGITDTYTTTQIPFLTMECYYLHKSPSEPTNGTIYKHLPSQISFWTNERYNLQAPTFTNLLNQERCYLHLHTYTNHGMLLPTQISFSTFSTYLTL